MDPSKLVTPFTVRWFLWRTARFGVVIVDFFLNKPPNKPFFFFGITAAGIVVVSVCLFVEEKSN
jgi:hypothetical protein